MSEFAKNVDDPIVLTDENRCEGFSACAEGDAMPMTAGFFNAVFCWLDARITAIAECITELSIVNLGGGVGLFSARNDKVFQFRTLAASKGLNVSSDGNLVTIGQSVVCAYSDADPAIPAGPPPTSCVSSILVDDCTDPANPQVYYWSSKSGAYLLINQGGPGSVLPTCPADVAIDCADLPYTLAGFTGALSFAVPAPYTAVPNGANTEVVIDSAVPVDAAVVVTATNADGSCQSTVTVSGCPTPDGTVTTDFVWVDCDTGFINPGTLDAVTLAGVTTYNLDTGGPVTDITFASACAASNTITTGAITLAEHDQIIAHVNCPTLYSADEVC